MIFYPILQNYLSLRFNQSLGRKTEKARRAIQDLKLLLTLQDQQSQQEQYKALLVPSLVERTGQSHFVEDALSGVVESAKKGINEGIKHVLTEQLALINLNNRSDMRYELLQAASYILHNVEKWEIQNDRSEAEVVGQVNEMLKIVFNSSKLKIKIGEIGAACTRENRKSRETSFYGGSSSAFITGNSSSSKKNINARKIDLMIVGANDVELSICEFKAKDEYRSLTKQSGKCARLNQALLEDLQTIEVDEMVIGMNWGDRSGELFGVQEADGVFICHQLSRLAIPTYRVLIGDVFVSLMKDLYAWKDHLEALNDKVIVNSARVGTIKRKRDSYVCCLTPKWAPNKK